MNARLRASIAMVLIICVSAMGVPPPAYAGSDARADARALLIEHGVTADDAAARVAALTDAEAQTLRAGIGELPAGGNQGLPMAIMVALVALFVAPALVIGVGIVAVAAASSGPRHAPGRDEPPSGEFPISYTHTCPSGHC